MKTKKITSGAPFLCCGALVLLYAVVVGFHTALSYAGAALLFFLAYAPLHRYFPDRFMVIEVAPNTGNIACDQLILEARESLKRVHEARARTPNDAIDEKVERIEALARQMLATLAKQPELQGQLRTFLRYYLPTTLKLVDARAQLTQGDARGEIAQRTLRRIEEALDAIRVAFEKQLTALDQFRYLNVETEIEVLRDLLAAEGLLDNDAAEQAPAAAQEE